jgi:hypothetical protein
MWNPFLFIQIIWGVDGIPEKDEILSPVTLSLLGSFGSSQEYCSKQLSYKFTQPDSIIQFASAYFNPENALENLFRA